MKRRNSYSDDTNPDKSYDNSNPPTLPRRSQGPPTFKPVPPPASTVTPNGKYIIT